MGAAESHNAGEENVVLENADDFLSDFGQPAAARALGGGNLKVILVRGDAEIEKALANSKPWMLGIIKYFCDRAAVEGAPAPRTDSASPRAFLLPVFMAQLQCQKRPNI